MDLNILKTNINLSPVLKDFKGTSNLKYLFLTEEKENKYYVSFSIVLKNSGNSIINNVWFSAFVGIGGTEFGPGLHEQNSFYFKTFLNSYISGYTKESIKLPPETILEILYFKIPKDKLFNKGSFEFYYGCESMEKLSFVAQWNKNEIKNKFKEINTQTFIDFLKHKNHKTWFHKVSLFFNEACKRFQKFYLKVGPRKFNQKAKN